MGFEDGFAEITFSTSGVDELKKLIDMSLGLEAEVEVAEIVTVRKRFGMSEPIPWHREKGVKIGMPDLLPTSTGFVKFKTDKLGPAFVFPIKFYLSPFNRSAPEELRKGRVAAQFFDWVFYPYTGKSNYTFSFDGVEFELHELGNAIRFLSQFAKPGQKVYCELHLDGKEFTKFEIDSPGMSVDLDKECSAIGAAHRILSLLNIHNPIRTSLGYITRYASRINEMHLVLSGEAKSFKMEFELGEPLDLKKEVACISFLSVPIGDVWLGVFMVITGKAILRERGRYNVFATTKIIERVVVRNNNEELDIESLVAAATAIEEKYMAEYDVVTLFNKEEFS